MIVSEALPKLFDPLYTPFVMTPQLLIEAVNCAEEAELVTVAENEEPE